MSIISVNAKELGQELAAWGVPHNYAILFLEKSTVKNGRVALHPFFFNDTEHMTNKRHWLAVDFNLFVNGQYKTDTADYLPLGEYWESLGGTWGGRFKSRPDGNHFSLEHNGVR